MSHSQNFALSWWHLSGTLPLSRDDHTYHVLRRVWADHTMTGARGFWATKSEDHLTTVLLGPFGCLSGVSWLNSILARGAFPIAQAEQIRFAFSCEELLGEELAHRHGRNFVIPDVMMNWRGREAGLIAVEAKKPGGQMPSAQDITKLETYTRLQSARKLARRHGLFLVDDLHVASLIRGGHFAVGWSILHAILIEALDQETGSPEEIAQVASALTKLYVASGVKTRRLSVPKGRGGRMSDRMLSLKLGLEIREAALKGELKSPPFPWLLNEPGKRRKSLREVFKARPVDALIVGRLNGLQHLS